MGFLDNSGDIILDAVLTDTGRRRLAKGDGSFNIKFFALGDDEINYGLYNPNHASGSAFYDLDILQTPVLEAFTNTNASLRSRLISLTNMNQLYWPEMILRGDLGSTAPYTTGAFVLAADQTTWESLDGGDTGGIIPGYKPAKSLNHIRVEQGLNTNEVAKDSTLDIELVETQYAVRCDNRLLRIAPGPDMTQTTTRSGASTSFPNAKASFSDSNNIDTYFFTLNSAGGTNGYVSNLGADSGLLGPGGTKLMFRLASTLDIQTSTYLFDTLGKSTTFTFEPGIGSAAAQTISTVITIEGLTTRSRLDIDVTLLKKS